MRRFLLGLAFAVASVASLALAQSSARFTVSFPAAVHPGTFTGRILVVVTTNDELAPRVQALTLGDGPPIFGRDADALAPGRPIEIGAQADGYPFAHPADLPAGDYFVEAFSTEYSQFHRADGHTVWVHSDWSGNFPGVAPGTLHSRVQKLHLDGRAGFDIKLALDQVLTDAQIAADPVLSSLAAPKPTEWIKILKFESPMLTKFWGKPIYLGATVLLPKGYAEHPDVHYPVVYNQGHFNQAIPWGFDPTPPAHPRPYRGGTGSGYDFYQAWNSDHFPRFILVTWQHPCPYFDDSYAVNSANCGPFGDAILQELIPRIETEFRILRQPYARILEGGSTGGWESLALQLQHPDFFGGAWVFSPDPIDFHAFQLTDLYKDKNAFSAATSPWLSQEKTWERTAAGLDRVSVRQMSAYERVLGSHGRSDFQLDGWWAIFDPVGGDGYPEPMWDMATGAVNPAVAAYAREHGYDLDAYMQAHWKELEHKLRGKLHFFAGDMDNYFLNLAVYRTEDFLKTTNSGATFAYGRPLQGHGWHPTKWADLLREIAVQVEHNAPLGSSAAWNY